MNAATLSRIKVTSARPTEMIEEMKNINRLVRFPGLYETAYYLAENDPQEFYTMRLWQNVKSIQTNDNIKRAYPQFQKIQPNCELQAQQVFRLAWEYRKVEVLPAVSTLRLTLFPKDFPQELIRESECITRQLLRKASGVLGVWVGYSLESVPLVRLHRIDWASYQDRNQFFYSEDFQAIYNKLLAKGVISIPASFRLQGLVAELLEMAGYELMRDCT
jgi:hypothetical protein